MVKKRSNCVIKVFPHHINTSTVPTLFEECVELSSSITFLVRKDFNSQVKSYYVAKELKSWTSNLISKIKLDEEKYNQYQNFLHSQIMDLSEYYKLLPNSKLVFLEDLPNTGKYYRKIFWDREPKRIDIDIEALFQR